MSEHRPNQPQKEAEEFAWPPLALRVAWLVGPAKKSSQLKSHFKAFRNAHNSTV